MHSSETTVISSARKELLHNVQGRLLIQMDYLVPGDLSHGVWGSSVLSGSERADDRKAG